MLLVITIGHIFSMIKNKKNNNERSCVCRKQEKQTVDSHAFTGIQHNIKVAHPMRQYDLIIHGPIRILQYVKLWCEGRR